MNGQKEERMSEDETSDRGLCVLVSLPFVDRKKVLELHYVLAQWLMVAYNGIEHGVLLGKLVILFCTTKCSYFEV